MTELNCRLCLVVLPEPQCVDPAISCNAETKLQMRLTGTVVCPEYSAPGLEPTSPSTHVRPRTRPLTAEARVRSWVRPCEICGGRSGTGTGFRFLPCQFHSYGAPLDGKMKKLITISSSSQGCTMSLKAAVRS
jgi:hypothetical protein